MFFKRRNAIKLYVIIKQKCTMGVKVIPMLKPIFVSFFKCLGIDFTLKLNTSNKDLRQMLVVFLFKKSFFQFSFKALCSKYTGRN